VIISRKLHALLAAIFHGQLIFIEDIRPAFESARTTSHAVFPSFSHPQTRVDASNLAYMIYTAGTTDKPKGVEVEHRGVVNMLHYHANVLLDQSDP
jgi:non-ribosomal peptide synthetase component F